MVIGLDARAAAEVPAGRGRFVRELLSALSERDDEHRYLLYCRRPWEAIDLDDRFEWVAIGLPDPIWHVAAALRANRGCDAFLSTNSYLTAWMLRVPTAVVVYDLVAFMPEMRPQARAARIERATIGPAVRRARRLLCISAATESDLIERFPRATGKTAVVPLAADDRFGAHHQEARLAAVARRHGVEPHGYVLATGTLEPRKNLLRLIRAHSALPDDLRDRYPLLIVGPRGWEADEILAAAGGSEGSARLAGFVSDEDLASLYAACAIFAYPSLYEGFGLPVLEAMAAGAAVLTSNLSSLPEVAGDAAVFVDPLAEDNITAMLESLLLSPDKRATLARHGRVHAASFSWERVAQGILGELESIAPSDTYPSAR
jgi:glycosyltransferase involved in cell wall biosynthesis